MSKNTELPVGMCWYYNPISDIFEIIVDKDCKYQNVEVSRIRGKK